jgi:hypothetical protein
MAMRRGRMDRGMETEEKNLMDLLAFIRGENHHYGEGITTHTQKDWIEYDDRTAKLHQDCLELERRGLLYRHYENDSVIVWIPNKKGRVLHPTWLRKGDFYLFS